MTRACGGGGFGDPMRRDRARIERVLELGYLTPEAAARDYGYRCTAAEEAGRRSTRDGSDEGF